jgi:hypothetical protein
MVNGELTVKRLRKRGGTVSLHAENPAYKPIDIRPDSDFEVWGMVTKVIHIPPALILLFLQEGFPCYCDTVSREHVSILQEKQIYEEMSQEEKARIVRMLHN